MQARMLRVLTQGRQSVGKSSFGSASRGGVSETILGNLSSDEIYAHGKDDNWDMYFKSLMDHAALDNHYQHPEAVNHQGETEKSENDLKVKKFS